MNKKSEKLNISIFSFIWNHFWDRPSTCILTTISFACSLGTCFSNIAIPYVISKFIDALIQDPHGISLWHKGWLLVLCLGLFQSGMYRIRVWIYWSKIIPEFSARLRTTLFNRLMQHSPDFFASQFAGSLANKIRLIADAAADLFEEIPVKLLENIIYIVAACSILTHINPQYAIIIITSICFATFIGFLLSRKCANYSELKATKSSAMTGFLVDSISNFPAVRQFIGWQKERELFASHQTELIAATRQMMLIYSLIWLSFGIIISIMQSGLLWNIAKDFQKNLVSAGEIALIVTYSTSIIRQLSDVLAGLPRIATCIGDLQESMRLIYQPLTQNNAKNAHDLTVGTGTIAFENVSFKYPNGTHVFKNLSLKITSGQKVGLVGFSGSGKSTLVHLLLRHYDIQSGTITIDNQNIAHITMDSLRAAIAHVPQDSVLFHRSLWDNIAYGRHDANHQDVLAASEKAAAHEFIETLNQGYETTVGERGVKLSGGQRQRIGIARAILSNTPILILDEATSALDSITEKVIQTSLVEAMQNRTTIVIAHRLATLTHLDRLLVMDDGQIVEDGTLDELLALNGHFARLWRMQSGGFLPEKNV